MTTLRRTLIRAAAVSVLIALAAPLGAQGNPAPAAATGDAARGRTLVESNGCFDCHRIAARGSRLGPDLSDIGDRRTPERLEQALVAPDAEVLGENRFVKFVAKDGTTVTGRILNQDALSVQLINQKEQLRSYLRDGLRDFTIVDTGLMPSYDSKLTPAQIADVVAYLKSLVN